MANETVKIRESRGWVFTYLIGSVALSSLFTPFVYADWMDGVSAGTVLTAAIVVGFWLMSAAFVHRLVRPLDLLLNADGFRLTNWKEPTPWADVEGFRIIYQRYDFWSRRMIYRDQGPGVRLVAWGWKSGAPRPLHRRIGRLLTGSDGFLPHTLVLDASDLIVLLEEWRQRYSQRHREQNQ